MTLHCTQVLGCYPSMVSASLRAEDTVLMVYIPMRGAPVPFLSLSLTAHKIQSAPGSLAFLLMSEHNRHVSTPGPLHLLLPQPEMLFAL